MCSPLHQITPSLLLPHEEIDARERLRKRYRYENMMSPYEKLKSLPDAHHHLKPGITLKQLDADASAMSHNDTARHLNQAWVRLFRSINKTQQPAA